MEDNAWSIYREFLPKEPVNAEEDEIYALWLQLACGICNRVYAMLFRFFSSCKEIYESEKYPFLNGKYQCEHALLEKDLTQARELQKRCRSMDLHVITYYDPRYPDLLRRIANPPAVLYAIGVLRDLNELVGVAVVGTRSMTDAGRRVAEDLAYNLTKAGATVISGLARGIDTCAHRGAVRANGYTIGVLGTPIDVIYPKDNFKAFHALYQRGLVISEMYPGCPSTRADFPNRNRIISGMSYATVIVQADVRSGSLITARHAAAQGRKVFAVPGEVGKAFEGTNNLIKDGVQAVTDAGDVVGYLAPLFPGKLCPEALHSNARLASTQNSFPDAPEPDFMLARTLGIPLEDTPVELAAEHAEERMREEPSAPMAQPKPDLPANAPEKRAARENLPLAAAILAELKKLPKTADELAEVIPVSIGELLSELTVLEIEGSVFALAGNRFMLK